MKLYFKPKKGPVIELYLESPPYPRQLTVEEVVAIIKRKEGYVPECQLEIEIDGLNRKIHSDDIILLEENSLLLKARPNEKLQAQKIKCDGKFNLHANFNLEFYVKDLEGIYHSVHVQYEKPVIPFKVIKQALMDRLSATDEDSLKFKYLNRSMQDEDMFSTLDSTFTTKDGKTSPFKLPINIMTELAPENINQDNLGKGGCRIRLFAPSLRNKRVRGAMRDFEIDLDYKKRFILIPELKDLIRKQEKISDTVEISLSCNGELLENDEIKLSYGYGSYIPRRETGKAILLKNTEIYVGLTYKFELEVNNEEKLVSVAVPFKDMKITGNELIDTVKKQLSLRLHDEMILYVNGAELRGDDIFVCIDNKVLMKGEDFDIDYQDFHCVVPKLMKKSGLSPKLMRSPYQQLSIEAKQYLSEATQLDRHKLGHISTEQYFNSLTVNKQQDLLSHFNEGKSSKHEVKRK